MDKDNKDFDYMPTLYVRKAYLTGGADGWDAAVALFTSMPLDAAAKYARENASELRRQSDAIDDQPNGQAPNIAREARSLHHPGCARGFDGPDGTTTLHCEPDCLIPYSQHEAEVLAERARREGTLAAIPTIVANAEKRLRAAYRTVSEPEKHAEGCVWRGDVVAQCRCGEHARKAEARRLLDGDGE